MSLPVDLGWYVTPNGQRKLLSWWPDSRWLILDGPGGAEPLALCEEADARQFAVEPALAELRAAIAAWVPEPATPHECDDGWIAVPDPILGDHIQARCPECQ